MGLQIVTNEVKMAEQIISGTYNKKLSKGKIVFLLAKYYIHHLCKDLDSVAELLHAYMRSVTDVYVWEMNDDYIKKTIVSASKHDLVKVDSVVIYESEIEQIRKAKNLTQEKVLFSYLVYAKVKYQIKEDTNGWVNNTSKDVFHSVGVNYTLRKRDMVSNELIKGGYLIPSKTVSNNSVQVAYLALTGKEFYKVVKFEQLGEQYEMMVGVGEFIECEVCSKLARKRSSKSNSLKYCNACQKDVQLELDRVYQRNKRFSKKIE
jgi:hypothetical protein